MFGQNLRHVGNWFVNNRMKAAPSALVGLAGAAGVGFMSSGGQAEGVTAGMGGAIGGAASGGFSGAMLGAGLGAGLITAGMYSSGMRPYVGRWIGKALSSRPVQGFAKGIYEAPMGSGFSEIQAALKGFMTDEPFLRTVVGRGGQPQVQAAEHLMNMLKYKQMQYLPTLAIAGSAGGLIGAAGGFATGAYRGGAQLRGPMTQTY